MTLYMTRGLPASGKTTWARTLDAKRICKDDLRDMLDDGRFTKGNEKFVLAVRDQLVEMALGDDRDVVVDDTNLAPRHEARLQQLAREYEVNFEVVEFLDVELEELVRRDLARPRSVGRDVIEKLYRQAADNGYIADGLPYNSDPGLPPAVMVDLDGTLAHHVDRSPFDFDRVETDAVDQLVVDYLRRVRHEYVVVAMSGRDGSCREATARWLNHHDVPFDHLYMRAADDTRKDWLVKRELFDRHVRAYFNVVLVLDDRDSVVRMWRRLGLTVWQVADGAF